MSRTLAGVAFSVALALLALGGAGFARASGAALAGAAGSPFEPSAMPALLGPINELGRAGWHCAPELAASAKNARGAELPGEDRP